MSANPVLARVFRSGIEESVHRGRAVVVDPDGAIERTWGDVDAVTYPRSATKPMQVIAMLEAGLDLDGALLALATASHSGEAMHLAGVRRILGEIGLSETDLANTPDFPSDEVERIAWIANGGGRSSITQNCSGKHAAMLRTCVRAGWPTQGYLDPEHPMQQAVSGVVERFSGERPNVGIDGCGAPAHTMSLTGLARAYSHIASSRMGAEHALAEAIRTHPDHVSGSRRWESALIRAVPGLIGKFGAEAVYVMALPNGQAMAIKLDDGGDRALPVIAVELLGLLGIRSEQLTGIATVPVLGHGNPVGSIECVLDD